MCRNLQSWCDTVTTVFFLVNICVNLKIRSEHLSFSKFAKTLGKLRFCSCLSSSAVFPSAIKIVMIWHCPGNAYSLWNTLWSMALNKKKNMHAFPSVYLFPPHALSSVCETLGIHIPPVPDICNVNWFFSLGATLWNLRTCIVLLSYGDSFTIGSAVIKLCPYQTIASLVFIASKWSSNYLVLRGTTIVIKWNRLK